MNIKNQVLKTIFVLLLGFSAYAQSGTLKGSIKELTTNEGAIGATVKLENSTLASVTDFEGNFQINNIPAGSYKVIITYIGFDTKNIENVRVEADKTTLINAMLEQGNQALNEVVVKARRMTGTEVSVISEIKELKNIAVGVSSQQITKTQDRDASQVIRRVPGISIFDDRFVIVRGLNERYNTVLLNDIITPSSEVDVKSFSFDLIPSTAIDRMMVYKSPSADLPGDMAGGAIKIYTKTVPDGNSSSFNFSVGYRSSTTGLNALSHKGSSTDFLGFDNGTRKLPSNFPSTRSVITNASSEAIIENFRNLNAYYDVSNQKINPDMRGSFNISRKFFIGKKEITNISYLTYSNTNTLQSMVQNRYLFDETVQKTFRDQSFQNNVRLGAMMNWAMIINPKNKIEFRNLFNQMSSKSTITRLGDLYEENLDIFNQAFRFEQRSIYSAQLDGTHELSPKTKLKWTGGLGFTRRNEPDFRRFTSARVSGTDNSYTINLQQFEAPTLQQAARFYSYMDEIVGTAAVNIDKVLGDIKENKEQNYALKVGAYTEYKDRYFKARWFGIVNPNRLTNEFLSLSPEDFFTNENLRASRVYYTEGTNFDDKYAAQNYLGAAYASLYMPLTAKLNATVGLREEFNLQMMQSRERGSGRPVEVNNPILSSLPSVNATYLFNDKNQLRFGYGMTVNRPEFRELAPFTYYDFAVDVTKTGNPDIITAQIHNFDLRYDLYPSKSELITLGVFYKNFTNPIEQAIFYSGSNISFTVQNAPNAYSAGVELELRKDLTDKLMVMFNGSLIQSSVKTNSTDTRFLQGQSPYLINSGVFYNNDDRGFSANIMYNIIGKRIYMIGDNVLSANVYEMPRNVLDFNLSKRIGEKLEAKIGIQDILNQSFRLIQDTNRDNTISTTDGVFQEYKRGSNAFAGLTWKF